ncbi:unnamed protein product, partial [Iphiclides podalirius]
MPGEQVGLQNWLSNRPLGLRLSFICKHLARQRSKQSQPNGSRVTFENCSARPQSAHRIWNRELCVFEYRVGSRVLTTEADIIENGGHSLKERSYGRSKADTALKRCEYVEHLRRIRQNVISPRFRER